MDQEIKTQEIQVDKKSHVLLWVFFLIVLISGVCIIWRFLVAKQYTVIEDPADMSTSIEE
ncbi:MAG: hypothetical protein AAB460_00665 [Patescibacteria group bacterium]